MNKEKGLLFSETSLKQVRDLLHILDEHAMGEVDVNWCLQWIETSSYMVYGLDRIIERMRERWQHSCTLCPRYLR